MSDGPFNMSEPESFASLVDRFYAALYRFAFSLAQSEVEACDLTQETFLIWARRGHQLRDAAKVKTWLFTTLHREFLRKQRRITRFPEIELMESEPELPELAPEVWGQLDQGSALAALGRLDETFRTPVTLFYLRECSYLEIAEILNVPLGTVKSRIARGLQQLQKALAASVASRGKGEEL